MAATNISGAASLPEADYSVPHRSPPPIPPAPTPRLASTSPPPPPQPASYSNLRGRAQEDSVSVSTSEHRRRGSFGVGSFLRRTASGKQSREDIAGAAQKEDVPPLPATRIAQAHIEAGRSSTSSSRKVSGEGRGMLRKSSKAQREQERQAREAERLAHLNRPPPQIHALDIDSHPFGDHGEPRPDSVAIFNHQYHSAATPPVPASRTNNFSRPGNNMPASSSPAYAVRGGSAYGSSPNMAGTGKVNGSKEYVVDPTERTESMTHRGRYSYASSMAPVNMSSPRRVRRRKDPTPFK